MAKLTTNFLMLVFICQYGEAKLPLCTEFLLPNGTLCQLDNESTPKLMPKPFPVKISPILQLKSIKGVNEASQYVALDLITYLKWTDNRIAFKGIDNRSLRSEEADKIWHPKLDYRFIFKKESVPQSGTGLWIYSSSHKVVYTEETKVSFTCKMDFSSFPFDSHTCNATFALYGATEDEMIFEMISVW